MFVMEQGVKVKENRGSCWPRAFQNADVDEKRDPERTQAPDSGFCVRSCAHDYIFLWACPHWEWLCGCTWSCALAYIFKIFVSLMYLLASPSPCRLSHRANYPKPQVDSYVCQSVAFFIFSYSAERTQRYGTVHSPSALILLGFTQPQAN